MARPFFTVLLPVNRSPELLPFAVETVLAQTNADFELFIICDGAPDATVACAQSFAKRHRQIRVFSFEKGERHGEAHRDVALRQARGPFVAQIGDDDLWFPDHLATLGSLLERVDFGNLLQAEFLTDGSIWVLADDLAKEVTRRRMCEERWNFFGPSVAGYRLSAYRSLPVGWSPAPADLWTDLHMWRKFLRQDGLAFGTSFSVQCLKLSAHNRQSAGTRDRAEESAFVAQLIADPLRRLAYQDEAVKWIWKTLNHQCSEANTALHEMKQASDAASAMFAGESERLRQELTHLRRLHAAAVSRLADLQSSRSWAITAPLRWIENRCTRRRN